MHKQPLTRRAGTFVGRQAELAALRAGLAEAFNGRGCMMMLAGEPGIGKTRLAEELASAAGAQGVAVHRGRCWDGDGAPAFWPWIQVLRSQVDASSAGELQSQMGVGAAAIAQVVPEVRARLPDLAAAPVLEPVHARFRLFDSITTFLKNAGRSGALAIILEDLHWADTQSLMLLQFLAREMNDAHLLVVGTYRDVEMPRDHPLSDMLGDLANAALFHRIHLEGWSADEIAEFIERVAERTAARPLVAELHRRTGGNPFFVTEIVRWVTLDGLSASETLHGRVPDSVRAVVSRRLQRLSAPCQKVLTLASVIGEEFSLAAVEAAAAACSGRGDDGTRRVGTLLEPLSEAIAARIVDEIPGTVGRYRFVHALMRETLYDELPLDRRVQLHGCVATALEQLYGTNTAPHVAELAHHFLQAAPSVDAEKAIDYAVRAGESATALLAHEDATAHFERALQALAAWKPADEERQCQVLLALGEARVRAGSPDLRSDQAFERAAELARRLNAPELLARAALGFAARKSVIESSNTRIVRLLEEAVAALGNVDRSLRALLLARLAVALLLSDAPERRAALSQEAVEVARRVGDAVTLASTLSARLGVLWRPENAEARLAITTEILELAERGDARELALTTRVQRIVVALELGDMLAVQRDMAACEQQTHELRQPYFLSWYTSLRAMLALLQGQFADAERLAQEALSLGHESGDQSAAQDLLMKLCVLHWERGSLAELEVPVRATVERFPHVFGVRAALAHLYAETGRHAQARQELQRLADNGFGAVVRDAGWLSYITMAAEASVLVGDRPLASTLYDLIAPYAGLVIVAGRGAVSLGSASFVLGRLAATLELWGAAAQHFGDALIVNTKIGALPWVAHTQCAYADMLLRRGQPEDRRVALQLLTAATDTADALEMPRLRGQILVVRRQCTGGALSDPCTPDSDQPLGNRAAVAAGPASVLRKEGDYWTVGFESAVFRLKDSVGLRSLAALLGRPGQEVLAVDLVALSSGRRVLRAGQENRHGGFVLDRQARAAYRRRLEALREGLADAQACADSERANRAQAEIDVLAEELAAAIGLRGRERQVRPHVERARVSATRAIKAAVRKVAAHDAALGRYLATTIKTGTFCSYTPDPQHPIAWKL